MQPKMFLMVLTLIFMCIQCFGSVRSIDIFCNTTDTCRNNEISCTNPSTNITFYNQENTDSCYIYCDFVWSCDYTYIDCGNVSNCTIDCSGPASCSNAIINATQVSTTFTMQATYDWTRAYDNGYAGSNNDDVAFTIENSSIYCPFTNQILQENCRFFCKLYHLACIHVNIFAKRGCKCILSYLPI